MPSTLHISDTDLLLADELLEGVVNCSRHALMTAALRFGLRNLEPAQVPEFLEGHPLQSRVRVRRPT